MDCPRNKNLCFFQHDYERSKEGLVGVNKIYCHTFIHSHIEPGSIRNRKFLTLSARYILEICQIKGSVLIDCEFASTTHSVFMWICCFNQSYIPRVSSKFIKLSQHITMHRDVDHFNHSRTMNDVKCIVFGCAVQAFPFNLLMLMDILIQNCKDCNTHTDMTRDYLFSHPFSASIF